mgnify:CR=1 FL=1
MRNILAYYTKDTNIYYEINNKDFARLKLDKTGIKKKRDSKLIKNYF